MDIAVQLGVDPRKPNQSVRGVVSLPNGTGKLVRVAVFARGVKAGTFCETTEAFAGIFSNVSLKYKQRKQKQLALRSSEQKILCRKSKAASWTLTAALPPQMSCLSLAVSLE